MPIREESFRIGSGRYLQGAGYLNRLGEEIARFGAKALLIGDATSLAVAREKSPILSDPAHHLIEHTGTCNHEDAKDYAALALREKCSVVVGFGGGVMMDLAKLVSHYASLPVLCVPTSSATCAACAALSVCYTKEGKTVGSTHYPKEVDAVLVDSEILLSQPPRLLLAGVFDAMAKHIEITQRYRETDTDFPIGLDYAFALAARTRTVLTQKTPLCLEAMASGTLTRAAEEVFFASLAATGVISGIARGSNQCALAHKFYEFTRSFYPERSAPYLHGEIVGVGLILQNHFNGAEKENELLCGWMKKYALPSSVAELGIDTDKTTRERYESAILASSAMEGASREDMARFRESMKYFWERR